MNIIRIKKAWGIIMIKCMLHCITKFYWLLCTSILFKAFPTIISFSSPSYIIFIHLVYAVLNAFMCEWMKFRHNVYIICTYRLGKSEVEISTCHVVFIKRKCPTEILIRLCSSQTRRHVSVSCFWCSNNVIIDTLTWSYYCGYCWL